MRTIAVARAVEVHGVLWIVDHLHAAEVCDTNLLRRALTIWDADPAVRLPRREIAARLRRLGEV